MLAVRRHGERVRPPADEAEVLHHLSEWRRFLSSNGASAPAFFKEEDRQGAGKLVLGVILQYVTRAARQAAERLRLWSLVVSLARFQTRSVGWGVDSTHCRLNEAYDSLGYALLQYGDVSQSICCLAKAWRVYPCPHNTSFGLRKRLVNALRNHADAADVVAQYDRFAQEFTR